MRLTLSILRCPDRVAPETRRFDGGEVVIGRGPGADWVLTDTAAKPLLSRRHCTLAYRSGAWTLTDTSTNGTTLNGAPTPEGQPTRALRGGDRLGIGPYEIEVSLAEEPQASSGFGDGLGSDWNTPPPFPESPFGAASPSPRRKALLPFPSSRRALRWIRFRAPPSCCRRISAPTS